MSEFVKGQTVRIKDNLTVGQSYGRCEFVDAMSKYQGKVAKVLEVDQDGDYKLDVDRDWWWNDDMIECLHCWDCKHFKTKLTEQPCSTCILKSNFIEPNSNGISRFREGQWVRIKDDLVEGKRYGNLTLFSDMHKYKGLVTRVRKITKEGNYKLNDDEKGYYWSEEMLEPVYCASCKYAGVNCSEEPCRGCKDYANYFPRKENRLSVNPPSLEALEKYIVDTTRAIFEADEERDQLEGYELKFIENLLTACCKHKIIRLARKEDDDNGDC